MTRFVFGPDSFVQVMYIHIHIHFKLWMLTQSRACARTLIERLRLRFKHTTKNCCLFSLLYALTLFLLHSLIGSKNITP